MLPEYTFNQDELRRAHALDEALRLANIGTTAKHVVEDAEKFERYLKGEADYAS